jgi:hypothetical protein
MGRILSSVSQCCMQYRQEAFEIPAVEAEGSSASILLDPTIQPEALGHQGSVAL